jgi:hypothetical protein
MSNLESFKIKIRNYNILSTGADGGHQYISSEINYNNKRRKITVIFNNKEDENKLNNRLPLVITGALSDDGESNPLLLNGKIKDNANVRILNRIWLKFQDYLDKKMNTEQFNDYLESSIEALENLDYEHILIYIQNMMV